MHMQKTFKSLPKGETNEPERERPSQIKRAIALLAPKPVKASVGLFASSSYMINPRQSSAFNKDYFYSNFICKESSQDESSSEIESQREVQPEDQDSDIFISEIGRNYSPTGSYDFNRTSHSVDRKYPSRTRCEHQPRLSSDRNSQEALEEFSSESHLRDLITSEHEIASIFARGLNQRRMSQESNESFLPLQIERVCNPHAQELDKMNEKFLESSQESNTTLATSTDSDFKLSYREDSCQIPNLKIQSQFFFQQENDSSLRGLEDLVNEQESRIRDQAAASPCQLEDRLHYANLSYY